LYGRGHAIGQRGKESLDSHLWGGFRGGKESGEGWVMHEGEYLDCSGKQFRTREGVGGRGRNLGGMKKIHSKEKRRAYLWALLSGKYWNRAFSVLKGKREKREKIGN